MEARTKTIEDWFALIRDGQITLPRFQRHGAWRPHQIEGVLENVLRSPSLPIGALLMLEVGDLELFNSRPIESAPEPQVKPQLNLLDGQQRMTALWRALNDTYEDLLFFVSLDDAEKPDVEICKRYKNPKGRRMPVWADDPVIVYQKRLFPAQLLCPGSASEGKMDEWTDAAGVTKADERLITKFRHRLASYAIPFLSLPVGTEQETALDVFINMNTSATPLKDFDIVVAQLERAVGDSLHDMIEELGNEIPTLKDYGRIEDFALAVGAMLNDKPPLKRTYLDRRFGSELAKVWPRVCSGLKRGIAHLNDEGLFNERLLPTELIVYLTSALWADVPEDGTDHEGHCRNLIRKVIWRASFTDRYLKTATTRAFADFRSARTMLDGKTSGVQPELFNEEQNPLPEASELIRGGWPSRKDRLGRAILAVSLYGGGYDFADGAKANRHNVAKREYHHIHPKSLLKDRFPDSEVNSALNCVLISWKTNRKIAAKSPEQYLNERRADAKASEDQVVRRLESHLVPYEDLIADDYSAFLAARAKLIHDAMIKLCDGSIPRI